MQQTSIDSNTTDTIERPSTVERLRSLMKKPKFRSRAMSAASQMEVTFRRLPVNVSIETERKRNRNGVSTTKYTWYSWLPKSIWEQFRRVANVYFLVISILMLIGTYATSLFVSPLDPYGTVGTLVFVLLVTSLKEGAEDLKRSRADVYENERKVNVVTFDDSGNEVITVKSSANVCPGDVIKLEGHCVVPVDMLLIATSLHKDGNKCFIETANIDGETNLKVKEAPPMVTDIFPELESSGTVTRELFEGVEIEMEEPNKNIHNFVGTMRFGGDKHSPVPLGADNLVLRSSIFSNTDWGYGIAVYTGPETKIQMNNRQAPNKMSKLEEKLNSAIILIFVAKCCLVTASVISIYGMGYDDIDRLPYVNPTGERSSIMPLWLEQWFVFFLLYNNFIPISLYVTIELVNMGQGMLMGSDINMYNEDMDVACSVRSSNLAQELGQVRNIFSDKTGTLTRNEMKLVKFVLNGTIYDIEDILAAVDGDVSKAVQAFGPNKRQFLAFCQCLTTCHTVVRESTGGYRAESPDELALVEGVANYNCHLVERGSKDMHVEILGTKARYNILAVNPFNSDRKRMSILLRDTETGEYLVMCKGADNIMMPLCKLDDKMIDGINNDLLDLANLGLRTLIVSSKRLSESEANDWLKRYREAAASTTNREENVASIGAELELDMDFIGITAIEDRLQDEVPEVIADLAKANIVLWMLTGDKLETAISIARSCNLLLTDTHLVYLTKLESREAYKVRLLEVLEEVRGLVARGVTNLALVMDGPSFTYFHLRDKTSRAALLEIGKECRSVVACRLTPVQKRELVRLVKKDAVPRSTTLSIGDGANDVAMIMEADVGIGIFGKEGRQAANNADVAIAEFKYLRRLLLVHGRWNYIRQSRVFLYSMHKNMVLTLTLFWYSYYTAVSGTALYQSWIYSAYNFILALPIIAFGIFDRDLSEEFVLKHPQVYHTGQNNVYLTLQTICSWIFNAICYAVVICLFFYLAVSPTYDAEALYVLGTTTFTGLCMALQLKVAFLHHQWAYPHVLCMFICVGGMFLFFYLLCLWDITYYHVAIRVYGTGVYWLFGVFLAPITTVMIDWVAYFMQYSFYPTEVVLFRELETSSKVSDVALLRTLHPEAVDEAFTHWFGKRMQTFRSQPPPKQQVLL